MFSPDDAVDACRTLLAARAADSDHLDKLHSYLHGTQALPILVTAGLPAEVRQLAEMSRVNVVPLPVDVMAQSLFVDGFRQPEGDDDDPVWAAWQANRMDARQTGVHRASLGYGASYTIVTPGEPIEDGGPDVPVIRGASPRSVTALYGDDPDWPVMALEVRDDGSYRVYDDEAVYFLAPGPKDPNSLAEQDPIDYLDASPHPFRVCPVVRFLNVDDLDGRPRGEIEPLIPLQDQIDHTTFDLLVAQHFGAFRQRYIMGWTADTEEDRIKVGANRFLTFGDADVSVGEFGQTDTKGFIDSRESTLRHMAIISQVPPHSLLGQMANLSAEALAAAEVGQRRKLGERKTSFGESWEQTFYLVGVGMGSPVADDAQVRWRDSEARSLAQTADALGKLAQMLGYPLEMLWEMIPGVTQQDLERAKAIKARTASFDDLAALLDRNSQPAPPTHPLPAA